MPKKVGRPKGIRMKRISVCVPDKLLMALQMEHSRLVKESGKKGLCFSMVVVSYLRKGLKAIEEERYERFTLAQRTRLKVAGIVPPLPSVVRSGDGKDPTKG